MSGQKKILKSVDEIKHTIATTKIIVEDISKKGILSPNAIRGLENVNDRSLNTLMFLRDFIEKFESLFEAKKKISKIEEFFEKITK